MRVDQLRAEAERHRVRRAREQEEVRERFGISDVLDPGEPVPRGRALVRVDDVEETFG